LLKSTPSASAYELASREGVLFKRIGTIFYRIKGLTALVNIDAGFTPKMTFIFFAGRPGPALPVPILFLGRPYLITFGLTT